MIKCAGHGDPHRRQRVRAARHMFIEEKPGWWSLLNGAPSSPRIMRTGRAEQAPSAGRGLVDTAGRGHRGPPRASASSRGVGARLRRGDGHQRHRRRSGPRADGDRMRRVRKTCPGCFPLLLRPHDDLRARTALCARRRSAAAHRVRVRLERARDDRRDARRPTPARARSRGQLYPLGRQRRRRPRSAARIELHHAPAPRRSDLGPSLRPEDMGHRRVGASSPKSTRWLALVVVRNRRRLHRHVRRSGGLRRRHHARRRQRRWRGPSALSRALCTSARPHACGPGQARSPRPRPRLRPPWLHHRAALARKGAHCDAPGHRATRAALAAERARAPPRRQLRDTYALAHLRAPPHRTTFYLERRPANRAPHPPAPRRRRRRPVAASAPAFGAWGVVAFPRRRARHAPPASSARRRDPPAEVRGARERGDPPRPRPARHEPAPATRQWRCPQAPPPPRAPHAPRATCPPAAARARTLPSRNSRSMMASRAFATASACLPSMCFSTNSGATNIRRHGGAAAAVLRVSRHAALLPVGALALDASRPARAAVRRWGSPAARFVLR